ncbi:WYL domain-containing protein [Streptomyces laculatispora]|uniref:WYL domain-containing protein n=1 Tax=Streptomyces laculatispora TaxID=887464 RepID=UPI003556ECD9
MPDHRKGTRTIQERFHLDAPGWYAGADPVPFLSAVAVAVWNGRALHLRYRRWREPTDVDRRLEPYGLVLKAGPIAALNGG